MDNEKKVIICPRCKSPNSVELENGLITKGLKCFDCDAQIS